MNVVLANLFGGWEIVLILVVVLVLFSANKWYDSTRGSAQAFEDFLPVVQRVRDPFYRIGLPKGLILWLAQGFGVGRLPVVPGTFGSLIGLAWFLLLLLPGSIWFLSVAMVIGAFASVRICGAAEKLLNQTDPASVVLDEIVALPLCFVWWITIFYSRNQAMPSPEYFFSAATLPTTLGVFLAFRLFDIWKPWPIRSSQRLHGGWGVTIDDVLAAAYVNLAALLVFSLPAVSRRMFPIPPS